MAREVTFVYQMDIPNTPAAKYQFKSYLAGLVETTGLYGDHREVGMGFEWKTRCGFDNMDLSRVTRRIVRAMKGAGMLARLAYPFSLGGKITYVASGEPSVTITLREE
jgi:hypothetical protein